MSTNSSKKRGTQQADACSPGTCPAAPRNRYFTGKRLTPDALRAEQAYLIERRRLMNRAMHGHGVVYGYQLSVNGGKLAVGPGLALDELGRELLNTVKLELSLADLIELPPTSTDSDCWLLRAHYAEELIAPVSLNDPCQCERQQWEQVCETVRYSLQRVPKADCCNMHACELACNCAANPCLDGAQKPRDGALACICAHLTRLQPGAACTGLEALEEGASADLHNGVALACVRLALDDCKKLAIAALDDACGPRRLVKRNDLLFDLIRGCDLTHISQTNWAEWHRKSMPWDRFVGLFSPGAKEETVASFQITFSRPVQAATVTAGCFGMTFLFHEEEGGWGKRLYAPLVGVAHGGADAGQPGLITQATLLFDMGWFNDAIVGTKTRFSRVETAVEIEIYGDLILDCNGQALDANNRGLSPYPSGNGTPGGTYRSTFSIGVKPPKPPAKAPLAANPDARPNIDTGGI